MADSELFWVLLLIATVVPIIPISGRGSALQGAQRARAKSIATVIIQFGTAQA